MPSSTTQQDSRSLRVRFLSPAGRLGSYSCRKERATVIRRGRDGSRLTGMVASDQVPAK